MMYVPPAEPQPEKFCPTCGAVVKEKPVQGDNGQQIKKAPPKQKFVAYALLGLLGLIVLHAAYSEVITNAAADKVLAVWRAEGKEPAFTRQQIIDQINSLARKPNVSREDAIETVTYLLMHVNIQR